MSSQFRKQVERSQRQTEDFQGLRLIGELMPAVLAGHGIDPNSLGESAGESILMFLEPARGTLGDMAEFLAMV